MGNACDWKCLIMIIFPFLLQRGKTKKGTIYGLGSVQYKNNSASVPIPVSLKRNLDVDMRMSGFETTISEVKEDIAGVKEDFTALKTEINAFKTEVTGGMSASQATLNRICCYITFCIKP